MTQRSVVFKALDWQREQNDDEEIFYVNGLTEKNKSVVLRVEGFTPFVNVELPKSKKWNKANVRDLYGFLKEKLKRNPPINYKLSSKYSLYHKTPGQYMLLIFKTHNAFWPLVRLFQAALDVPGAGSFYKNTFKVHEHNIDPIIKFTATRQLKLGSWIKATEYIPEGEEELSIEERKFSTADIDMHVNYKQMESIEVPDTIQPVPTILSFDIETYSENHDIKLPDPTVKENEIIEISMVVSKGSDRYTKYLLSLERDFTVEDTKVLHYDREKDLLIGFPKMMQKINPDIIIGYNILKFDYPYMIARANMLGIYPTFAKLGRIIGVKAKNIKKKWESGAYGEQIFEFLECQGRLTVDMILEIERNFKLDSYSLNFVSEHFLGESKRPLPIKQMFKLYQFTKQTRNYHNYTIDGKFLKEIKDITKYIFEDEEGIAKEFYESVNSANTKNIKQRMKKAMSYIGDYCVHDSVLPLNLLFKLRTLFNLTAMANIFCVPISYLQTRGQQIKVVAQVYRYTLYNNIVIPYKKENATENYQGSTVFEANPGFWKNVAVLDFASLYPTIMIANNIDYTSYVDPQNDNILDTDCNIIDWEDHVGCIHDPQKRKRKKEKVLCGSYRHKFRKVVEKDGKRMYEGVLPYLLRNLLTARKKVKNEIKILAKSSNDTDKDIEMQLIVLDAKQLAIKISANSMYGVTGAKTGYMPLIPAAASVTAMGRTYIQMTCQYILKNFKNSRLVYGDTDSTMIYFDTENIKEVFELAKKAAKDVTALFPSPIELEFECVYGKFLLLTKKRYIAYMIDEKGNVKEKIKKGVVLKRRDNTHFLKDVYGTVIDHVMEMKSEEVIFSDIYDNILKLFTYQIPSKDLVIYKGIKDLISYAKSVEIDEHKYFLGNDKQPLKNANGRPYVTNNPLDPNLVYDHIPHVMLGLKMKERGEKVPPNTRLQYVFLDIDSKLQGERIEDYTYFKENKNRLYLRLDPLYYFEKQLMKPITEIINVLYKNQSYKYEALDVKIRNYEHSIFKQIDSSVKDLILDMKEFIDKGTKNATPYSIKIQMVQKQIQKFKSKKLLKEFQLLVQLYFLIKSKSILNKVEKVYGIKKRPSKRPDKNGLLIKDGTVMKDILKYKTDYKDVVKHLNILFYDLITEEKALEKEKIFEQLNMQRYKRLKEIEQKNKNILNEMYLNIK